LIGGIVLAAGGASRFGSPKQLAELDGVPLLQHAIDAMLAVPAIDPVVVVLGAEAERVRAAVDLGEALSVVCDRWADGMAASLRCGVEAAGDCDWVIVTLGDQPRVTPQVIAAVMDHAVSAPAGTVAVRATYDGAPGHPVALGRAMLPHLAQLSGDAGARDLLGGADVRTFEAARLCDPTDVDTPEELEALRT
jgi:CTP:molybdopterin cytidylyltransferase MocA